MRPFGLGDIKDVHIGTQDYPQSHKCPRNLTRVKKDSYLR